MVEDPVEAEKGEKLCASARGYLGIDISLLGVIFRDELQSVALGSSLPILRYKPGCVLSRGLYRIANKLLNASTEKQDGAQWLNSVKEDGDAPFNRPEEEAAEDFKEMRRDLEDLLNSGALSMADLVESVRSQQIELSKLRLENAFLHARLKHQAQESTRP
jgi:flagellar biosynthesis protein FlhG